MSRPITLTDDIKSQIRDELLETLKNLKMFDGKFSYSKSFKYENSKAIVWFAPNAYRKTVSLITEFSDEIAWHGTVTRVDGKNNEFIIEDIFVYPQVVSGSSVNTDQAAYTNWLYEQDDDIFNKIRMQGHSHVNMGVTPSGVDNNHREKILEQLDCDMFYIFMIWNKSLSVNTIIYDMKNNILAEHGYYPHSQSIIGFLDDPYDLGGSIWTH